MSTSWFTVFLTGLSFSCFRANYINCAASVASAATNTEVLIGNDAVQKVLCSRTVLFVMVKLNGAEANVCPGKSRYTHSAKGGQWKKKTKHPSYSP